MEIVQYIILRKDLQMTYNKGVAQGSHSVMKIFFDRSELCGEKDNYHLKIPITNEMKEWWEGIFTKIVLVVNSEEELVELYEKAKEMGFPCCMIEDVGRTEFGGKKTKTAIAIGPDVREKISQITSHLKTR